MTHDRLAAKQSKRRRILGRAAALALLPFAGSAPSAQSRPILIGLLDAGERVYAWDAFRERMRELGYVEGRDVAFIQRYAKGNVDATRPMAAEMVQQRVAVIVTTGAVAALAAQRASSTIPIVMASGADQVGLGLASSFARPGGNITGVSSFTPDLMPKRLDLLRELVPKISRVGALWHRDNSPSMASVRELDGAAAKANLGFESFAVTSTDGLDDAFATMVRRHIDGVVVLNGPLMYVERRRIGALLLKYRLPAMSGQADYVDAGFLISYGPSYTELARHAAVYVDKILKGANAGDLPIELPTTFELALNATTARALGVTIPSTMSARATRTVQ